MKILFCGEKDDYPIINEIKSVFPDADTFLCKNSDKILRLLTDEEFDISVVAFNGANGMESVITLRKQQPDLPVVWLSDDGGFATQAYRLGTAYFHEKPITAKVLAKALEKCFILNHI